MIMNDKEKNEFRKFLITVLEDFDFNKDVEIYATADKIQDKVVTILPIERVRQQREILMSFQKFSKKYSKGFFTIPNNTIDEFLEISGLLED